MSHLNSRAASGLAAGVALLAFVVNSALAQTVPQIPPLPPPMRAQTMPAPKPPSPEPAAQLKSATAKPEHVALIRATLSALNDANLTGNYSVLRDAAAPSFAERYSVADLAIAFTTLRNNPLFTPASQGAPAIAAIQQPGPDTLVIGGHVPARPANLDFNVQYQRIGVRWRLSALSVSLPQPKSAQASPPR